MKRFLALMLGLALGSGIVYSQSGPATPANLRVAVDSSNNLMVVAGVAGTPQDPVPFMSARLRTDSSGQLMVVCDGCGGGTVTEADLDFSDITLANSSVSEHGLLPKLSGDADQCFLGSGAWGSCAGATSGGAATTDHFVTTTAEGDLSAEENIGALATGLLVNTVTAGVGDLTAYAGATCTNQFIRVFSAVGAATCASVANADLAGSIAASKLVGTDIATVGTITAGVWTGTDIALANIAQMAARSVLGVAGAATADMAAITAATDHTVLAREGTTLAFQKIIETMFTFTDVTTANATTSEHGLLPKGDGDVGNCLSGVLTWVACGSGGGGASVSDTAYDATTWNGVTTVAPSKNAIRDLIETFCQIDDPGGHRFVIWDETDNACASGVIGAGLTYTQATHTFTTDVTLTNSVTLSGKIISGSSNTLTVLGATQISGDIPVTNLVSATNRDNTHFLRGDGAWIAIAGGGDALVGNSLAQFAATTSAELATLLTNETGTSLAVFNTSPTLVTPLITGNRWQFAAKTADYTVAATDSILSCDASGSSVTVTFTLPTAASVSGKAYTFVRIDTDADGLCVLDGNSSETVGGAATLSMPFDTAVSIASDNTNWVVTGSSPQPLSAPAGDRIPFFDFSAQKYDYLTLVGCSISGTTLTCSGAGTVTNTGGNLTSNALVIGAGTVDTKVLAGLTTDGTAKLILGVDSTTAGTIKFWNATSGSITLTPATGALGTVTITMPAATGTVVLNDLAATLSAKTMVFNGSTNFGTFYLPQNFMFKAGNCQNATASIGFDLPSSAAATAGCASAAAGVPAYGYALFPLGGTDYEVHGSFPVPDDWTGAIDLKLTFNTNDTDSANITWGVKVGCTADGQRPQDVSFNDTLFSAVANKTTALQRNSASKTGLDVTGCAAGETAFFIIHHDTDMTGDTFDKDVRLIDATFVVRRAIVAGS